MRDGRCFESLFVIVLCFILGQTVGPHFFTLSKISPGKACLLPPPSSSFHSKSKQATPSLLPCRADPASVKCVKCTETILCFWFSFFLFLWFFVFVSFASTRCFWTVGFFLFKYSIYGVNGQGRGHLEFDWV